MSIEHKTQPEVSVNLGDVACSVSAGTKGLAMIAAAIL
jgi:hypothetical protein